MSIGRRLIDMARSELNSLLDVAAKHAPDDEDDGAESRAAADGAPAAGGRWSQEAEWLRKARQEVEDAIHGRRTAPDPEPSRPSAGARGGANRVVGEALRVHKAYAALEVRQGADFETVRRSYRNLMRKYHPDHHTGSPEKQKAANDIAQGLTEAYKLLEKKLRK